MSDGVVINLLSASHIIHNQQMERRCKKSYRYCHQHLQPKSDGFYFICTMININTKNVDEAVFMTATSVLILYLTS